MKEKNALRLKRWLAIPFLAVTMVPFLADLQSPLDHGNFGIAYAKGGGGGGGGGHDGGGGGAGGGASGSSGSDGGRGGSAGSGGGRDASGSSASSGGQAGSQSSGGSRDTDHGGLDAGRGHDHGGRSAGISVSAGETSSARSGNKSSERSRSNNLGQAMSSVAQSVKRERDRNRATSAQKAGVKIEGAEVKVRGPLTADQFNSLLSSLSTTQVREVNIRDVQLTQDQLTALENALKTQTGLREVNFRGVTLTQDDQFHSLVSSLQAIPGLREAKVKAIVDGQPLQAHIENNQAHVQNEIEAEEQAEEAAEAEAQNQGVAGTGGGATVGGAATGSGRMTGSSTPSMMTGSATPPMK